MWSCEPSGGRGGSATRAARRVCELGSASRAAAAEARRRAPRGESVELGSASRRTSRGWGPAVRGEWMKGRASRAEDSMAVTVYIPTPFRRATNNRDRLEASAKTVGGLLDELEGTFAGLKGLVRDEGGEVHHHVNIYVNSEAIESLDGLATLLKDGDEVAIIPALAGGG